MTLIRIGLNLKDLTSPCFNALGKLKGVYGLECISFGEGLELFLFIKDSHFQKLVDKKSREQIEIYFQSFGLKKDDFVNTEIISDNYYEDKYFKTKFTLKGYLDFSNVSLSILKSFSTAKISKGSNFTTQTQNLVFELVSYAQIINSKFILQMFTTSKHKQLSVSGQMLLSFENSNYNFIKDSINENFKNITKKYGIKFLSKSKFKLYNKLKMKHFLKHIPFKMEKLSPIFVNEILKIPSFNHLNNCEIEHSNFNEINDVFDLEIGIPLGFKLIPGLKNPPFMIVSFEELTSHFCCFGMTSQGKSRLMYNFLSFLGKTEKNFLVVDPKGEYFEALAGINKSILYYKVGSTEYPLRINIFSVPKGLTVESHIQFIYSLLLNIMGDDVTPQMNRLLFKATEYIISNNGSMIDFISLLEHPDRLKIKGSYLELSGSAVLNRLTPLIIGPSKNCFLVKHSSLNFSELIIQNVIIDLSEFELIENKISRKIFVNAFLHNVIHAIKFKNSAIRELGLITNFILIEEIQKIAPLTFQGRNEVNSFIGLAPWTVRAYGICMGFIGTDANVETPIITNTGISFIFYTKSNVEFLLKLMGISFSEYNSFLSELQQRKKFLVCYKGNITLTKSFDFQIPEKDKIVKTIN